MSVEEKIQSKIKLQGAIPLNEFLEIALFDEKEGYYQSQRPIMGGEDFITAPEMSHLFAQALDEWLSSSIQSEGIRKIIELGPGTGMLAGQLMQYWQPMIDHYQLIEKSIGLRRHQQSTLKDHTVFSWPEKITKDNQPTLLLANEFLDVLPARRFCFKDGHLCEMLIRYDDTWQWIAHDLSEKHLAHYPEVEGVFYDVIDYKPFFEMIDPIDQGIIVAIDYGYHASEYSAHPELADSLRGFYQNEVISNPFDKIGQMDLTVDVNFSRLAHQAEDAGWKVNTYFRQADLMYHLLSKRSQLKVDPSSIKQFMYPTEMGERVRVLVFTRKCKLNSLSQLGLERL